VGDPTRRAAGVFVALAVVIVLHALCASYVFGALWDWRVFQTAWYDHAWHLELAWLARIGEWSGRDFHYPRGPLWQLVAYVASQPWREDLVPSDTLAGIALAFRLGAVGIVTWIAWRRVESPWFRPIALFALASLSFGAGVPTFRALVSLLIILVYVPPTDEPDPKPWGRAFAAAGLTGLAMLLSFDRFGIAALSLGAATAGELLHRRRRGDPLRPAVERALRYGAAIAIVLALLAALGAAFDFDPITHVIEQRRLATGYASGMRTPWYVGVPPANIAGLFVCGVGVIVLAVWRGASRAAVSWMTGALPSALFGVITSDEGHIYMAILPFAAILVLLVGSPRFDRWSRVTVGLLGGVTLLGWFGTYPNTFSLNPRVFADAWAVAHGDKGPERAYASDHSRAIAWARTVVRDERPECLAFWPSLTIAHAMAQVPGPTRLGLRWNDDQQRELAERIRNEPCPRYLHNLLSFDDIGGAWFLGPDFLAIVETYEYDERIGAGLVAMRRRAEPAVVPEVALGVTEDAFSTELPAEIRVPFDRPVDGTSVIRLDYTLDVPTWRAQLGGLPWAEIRFERDGEPLGDWERLHHLRAGDGTVLLAPDPEAVEWLWIGRRTLERHRQADALRIRFERRGRLTPSWLALRVRGVTEHRPPDPPPPEPAPWCRAEVDLLEELRESHAYVRMTAPRTAPLHFHLDPNPPLVPIAEVLFPIRPCEESCFFGSLSLDAVPSESDGAVFEIHIIRRESRDLLAQVPVVPGAGERAIELPIGRWPDEPQLLRIGTRPNEHAEHDYAMVTRPRIAPCTSRRWLAEAVRDGDAEVTEGDVAVAGRDLVIARSRMRLERPMRVMPDTCFGLGWRSEGAPVRARLTVAARLDDLEQIILETEVGIGTTSAGTLVALHELTDRDVDFVVALTPLDPADAPTVRLLGPHLYRCVQ
jgi:hypothetical protein